MTDHIYPLGMLAVLGGSATSADNTVWSAATDTLGFLLLKGTYTFANTHHYVSDLTPASNEVSGTGYARKSLGTTRTTTNNAGVIQCDTPDPATFTAANGWTSATAVVFKNTGSDATSELITIHDCAVTANGGDITVQFSASPSAVFTVTPA